MLRNLREKSQSESGFTLIELLVVVLILGILAAIAVPSFLNQRTKGQDASAKSYVRTAQTAGETHAVDNDGTYTGMTKAGLEAIEPALKNANSLEVTVTDADTVAYKTTSDSTNTFTITVNAGEVSRTCTAAGKGACKSNLSW